MMKSTQLGHIFLINRFTDLFSKS